MNTSTEDPLISCNSMIFSKLFHTGKFEIPWHQRHYDWKQEHVSDLLRDIDEAIQQKLKCYFLGSIMLVEKDSNLWEINDGQQRMVTFSLICARLCSLFHQNKKETTVQEALTLRVTFKLGANHTKNLSNTDDLEPRLIPPCDDKTRYNLMMKGKSIGTNGKLTTAWKEIDRFVSAMGLEKAKNFLDFLLNNVEVACLYIPKEKVDPNTVFETINCRGKQLEDFDLIRNNLYSYFSNRTEQNPRNTVHDSIERIRTQLRTDKKAADYSRCFFQCKYGFLAKDSFYRETRNEIRRQSDDLIKKGKKPSDYTFDLIDEFACREQIDLFHLIEFPDANSTFIKGFSRDSGTLNSARSLSILLNELKRYTVAQPMVFAFLCRYSKESDTQKKKKIAKLVYKNIRKITSLIMRTAFVTKFEPSHFESEFSDFAEKIWSRNSLESLNMEDFLKACDDSNEGIINDIKFRDKLSNLQIKSPKAKVFLIGLSHYEQHDRDIIDYAKCTVEHVLPSSPKHWSGWKKFDGQDIKDWVDRLGNLTLLSKSDNKPDDKTNGSFSNKKPLLKRSAITLNKEIVKKNDWSPHEIETRQRILSKLAARVWSFR